MDSRRHRIGLVSELPDTEEAGRLSGLFAAHWESEDPRTWGRGPDGVPVAEAIEWARRHATRVSVLLGDSDTHYSAGEEDLGDDAPRWPDGLVVCARPDGAPLDGSVQEVLWDVVAELDARAQLDGDAVARMEAAIDSDNRVAAVSVEIREGETLVHCKLTARGMGTAVTTADGLITAALDAAAPGAGAWLTSTAGVGPAA